MRLTIGEIKTGNVLRFPAIIQVDISIRSFDQCKMLSQFIFCVNYISYNKILYY